MFAGKVVLITGASSGIGAECAENFAREGASLSLVARNLENLSAVAKKCEKINNLKPLIVSADVTTDCQRIIGETIKNFGRLDILLNNAGIMATVVNDSIDSGTLESFDKTINTNLRAVYQLTQLAVPHLIKTKGNIVNTSSLAGLRAFPNYLSYCISKAGLDQFTKCVALELGPRGVRVNSVNPTLLDNTFFTNNGLTGEELQAFVDQAGPSHPLGRVGTSTDAVDAILFLASDKAKYITGTLLPVCGGKSISCPL